MNKKEAIQTLKKLYDTPPYNIRILNINNAPKNVAENILVNNYEKIIDKYHTHAQKKWHWYISINPYKSVNGRLIKTGRINKIVLDFDSLKPDETIQDAKIIYEFLKKSGYDPLVFSSGRKGLHIHFKIYELQNCDIGIKNTFEFIKHSKNLITMDSKVYSDQSARITRLPGSKHPLGDWCRPVDIYSAESITDMDTTNIHNLQRPKEKGILETLFIKRNIMTPKPKQKYYGESHKCQIENWEIMHLIYPQIHEIGIHQYGNKYIVKCPYHNDNNPSAFYDEKMFHCSTCNISIGVWKLLTQYEGYTNEEAHKIIMQYQ